MTNPPLTDTQLVAQLRQSLASCQAHYVGDWQQTSIHRPAGELDRIVALAELALKMKLVTVEDERSYLVVRDAQGNQWPIRGCEDPDTTRLEVGPAEDWMGENNGD